MELSEWSWLFNHYPLLYFGLNEEHFHCFLSRCLMLLKRTRVFFCFFIYLFCFFLFFSSLGGLSLLIRQPVSKGFYLYLGTVLVCIWFRTISVCLQPYKIVKQMFGFGTAEALQIQWCIQSIINPPNINWESVVWS